MTRLAEFAVAHAIEIAVLAAVVAVLCRLFGRRWPHLAYALWLVVLLKCLVPPLHPFPAAHTWLPAAPVLEPAPADRDVSGSTADTSPDTDGGAVAAPAPLAEPSPARWWPAAWVALVAWGAGALFVAGVAVGRNGEFRRALRHASRPLSQDLAETVDGECKRLGLARAPRVLAAASGAGPVVAGVLRPTVYLPEALLAELPPERVRALIDHELTHVRRGDSLVLALQFLAQVVWWPHPAVWWMNRELVRHRERCCDEEVIAARNGERREYASSIVDVLEAGQVLRPLYGFPGMRPAELTRSRLEEIMNRKSMTHRRSPLWAWGTALMLAAVVLPFGAFAPAASGQEESKPAAAEKSKEKEKDKQPKRLQYGDGKPNGHKSYGGNGHLIRFTRPEGDAAVRAVRIHGSRYGARRAPQENFDVTLLSDDMEEVIGVYRAPYALFRRGDDKWVTVRFEKPIPVPKDFWVALDFHAHQTKGVYVSYDTSTKGEHSRMGLVEEPKKTMPVPEKADWMVQAVLQWDADKDK